jgi:hypothetical protein
VVLLGYPLMYSMTPQIRQNDLVYYQAVSVVLPSHACSFA